MKKIFLFIGFFAIIQLSYGQEIKQKSGFIIPVQFNLSIPLRDIPYVVDKEESLSKKEQEEKEEHEREEMFDSKPVYKYSGDDGYPYGNDSNSVQREQGKVEGLQSAVSVNGETGNMIPNDPTGAAGPNHYVQMVNATTISIYDKQGSLMLTKPLGGLWTPSTANNGDPIVLYDKNADRWLLAQFGDATDKKIFIAISTSPDPLGTYYTYTYIAPVFPDYPKFGVWHDGFYMTCNPVGPSSPPVQELVYAFDRSAMLTGTLNARGVWLSFTPPTGNQMFSPLPGDAADGILPASNVPCPIFCFEDNGWGGASLDRINIYSMTVNWIPTIPTANISLTTNLNTAAFDGSGFVSGYDIPQPGTSQRLQALGGMFMYRAQYKRWNTYGSVLLNWTVKISANQRAIKWCELRRNNTTGIWSLYQEGTYAPDTNSRWMGSISMDDYGSIGIAYMKSNSSSIFPGLYYTGRRACDPLGTFPLTEMTGFAGSGSTNSGATSASVNTNAARIGDYSHTSLDPDGTTFWHTGEYLDINGIRRTRIFSFQILPCNGVAITISMSGNPNTICKGSTVNFNAIPTNGGTLPHYQWRVNGINVGSNLPTFSSNTLQHNDIVTCILTSNQPGAIINPATSNAIKVAIHENEGNAKIVLSDSTICQGSTINLQASLDYCIPKYNFGTSGGDYISQVHMNILNVSSGASTAPYYTPPTGPYNYAQVHGNSSQTIHIYCGSTNTSNYVAAWIDFNGDKSFDNSEKIGQSSVLSGPYAQATFNYVVPMTALAGMSRLRVRMVYGQPNIDPCSTENFGETEDYDVQIISTTGTAFSPNFTWTSMNTSPTSGALVYSTPSYSQAYTVQSTDAFGCTASFTSQPVLVNSFNVQTTATPVVICTGSSSTITVGNTINYCQPAYSDGTATGYYISQMAIWDQSILPFGNFILSNTSGASSSPYYTLFPASGNTTATLQAGQSYTMYLNAGTSATSKIIAFIDYDRNGDLTQGLEKIGEANATYGNNTGFTFTIPSWAHNGTTRLRLRITQFNNSNSCSYYDYGETEDYTITIAAGVTPAANTYNWLPASTSGSGNTVTATPSTSTEYTVVVTDAAGCTASAKTSVMVATPPGYYLNNPNPLWICAGDTTMLSVIPNPINYCEPAIANGTGLGDFISNVTIQGTTLSNTTGASSSPYRTLYPQSGSTTASLTAGNTYLMYVSNGSFTSYNNISAWIDYDGDGNYFEATEKIGESGFISGAYGVGTISFKIPTWAKNGTTRLRVREAYGNLDLEACNSSYPDGELEDYLITITGGVAPTTYSWNPLGGSSTSASTFIMPTYTQTYTLTASDGYNCANTATITAYVNSPTVQATASSSSICLGGSTTLTANDNYCIPTHSSGNTSGDFIEAVSLDGTSLNNTSGANTTSYTLYNAAGNTTTILTAGNTYTLTVTVGSRNFGNTFAAWMDFDRNHELNNGFEKLGEVYNLNGNASVSLVFTVPVWANDGLTRLRISETYFTPGMLACATNMYGETEDYPITITGGLYAGITSYVWNDALGTTSSSFVTTPNYSTQYMVTATDANGCSKTSTTSVEVNSAPSLSITGLPTSICAGSTATLMANYTLSSTYCNPQTFNGNSGGNYISQVSIQGTTLSNTTGALANPFYFLYPSSGNTTATLVAGNTYLASVTMGTNCCNNSISAWIDYNQNYSFEQGIEKIASFTNISGNTTQYFSFTVPSWAKNGSARLRVREAFNITNMNACTTYGQGETEDYILTITNGVTTQSLNIIWNPTTSPTTGPMVSASPTSVTTYTATLTDQYGCSNSATQTISMNTLASFYTNAYQSCVDSMFTFNASPIACSGNTFSGNGTSYGATLLNSWAMTQTSNFTMEAWVKWNGSTGSNQIIFYNGNSTTNGYGLMVSAANANKLAILCGGSITLNTNITLSVGVWQHLVIKRSPTLSGGFWNIYVDGVSYNPSPNTGIPIAPTTGGTYVGRGASGNYFNGSIDEVRFWNSMLSNAQISANKVGCIAAPQSNLVGYWKFNESIGSTICADASGGNRTLTLSNALARNTAASYAWNYGDGNMGTGISSTHNYLASGNKNVTLTVTDITGCYANDFQTIHVNHCYKTLDLKLFLQGYYSIGNQTMTSTLLNQGQNNTSTQTDTISVELHDIMLPQNIIATFKGVLNTDGTITCNFYNLPSYIMGYYIAVKHRNSIETWSSGMLMFNSLNQANYDFTTADNKAYGNNQVEVEPNIWAFYSGDINQDDNIDLGDFSLWELDNSLFAFGYEASDINGDGNVDLGDVPFVELNTSLFIFSNHP